jgi:NADH-quinone oxidoreductase subunit N
MIFFDAFHKFCMEFSLSAIIFGILILDIVYSPEQKKRLGQISFWLVFLLLIVHLFSWGNFGSYFGGSYVKDAFSYFFQIFFLLTALFVIHMSKEYMHRFERGHGEFYLLILLSTLGMNMLASSANFILLFVNLELITISLYIMTAYLRTDPKSIEAGLKYLILGALSSGFLLYGISFIYGITGSIQFTEVAKHIHENTMNHKGILFGFILILTGIGFKIASVPFQFWVPDVYEGAPTPVTALLSVGSKAAGFLILSRLCFTVFPDLQNAYVPLFAALSAMSLFYGNLGAIPQKNIKRFLGYSSIGHAGYLLMGYAAGSAQGLGAVLYYLTSYLFTNLGAFLIIVIFSNATNSDEISDFDGLSQKSPLLAAAMLICLMSLAGIPPLAGFFGKFLLINSAVQRGLIWLAFIGAVNVIISLYYYLMIVKRMYIHEPAGASSIEVSLGARLGIYASMTGIVGLGVFQGPLVRLANLAVKSLF